jgi:chorismate mutase
MVEQQNLDYLREEMQNITNQIIKLVHDRMEVKKNWQYKTTIEN